MAAPVIIEHTLTVTNVGFRVLTWGLPVAIVILLIATWALATASDRVRREPSCGAAQRRIAWWMLALFGVLSLYGAVSVGFFYYMLTL